MKDETKTPANGLIVLGGTQKVDVSEHVTVSVVNTDWSKAAGHLEEVKQFNLLFAGKAGYNPFFFLHDSLEPLERELKDGKRTPDLYNKIMALPKIEPKVSNSFGALAAFSEVGR